MWKIFLIQFSPMFNFYAKNAHTKKHMFSDVFRGYRNGALS